MWVKCCASGCCAHRGKPRVVEHVVVPLEEGVVTILLCARAAWRGLVWVADLRVRGSRTTLGLRSFPLLSASQGTQSSSVIAKQQQTAWIRLECSSKHKGPEAQASRAWPGHDDKCSCAHLRFRM